MVSTYLLIAFGTKALRRLAESQTLAVRKFGPELASVFHALLADMVAAQHIQELPMGFVELPGTHAHFAVALGFGFQAIFASNHAREKEMKVGSTVAWHRINRVILLTIGKANG